MISPSLWSDVPFRNPTALRDFQGYHALWHQAIADVASRTGKAYSIYPLGDGVLSPNWQAVHQREHINMNLALGISGPPILVDYDPNDPVAFASFMFIHGQESIRVAAAAGVV